MFIKGNNFKIDRAPREDKNKVMLAPVELYIRGIAFPTNKQALYIEARANNAPENVMNTLKQFQDIQYQSMMDVSQELKQISRLS